MSSEVVVHKVIILVLAYALGVYPATGAIGYLLVIFHSRRSSAGLVGISSRAGTQDQECRDGLRNRAGAVTFPLLVHEAWHWSPQVSCPVGCERLHFPNQCQHRRKRDSNPSLAAMLTDNMQRRFDWNTNLAGLRGNRRNRGNRYARSYTILVQKVSQLILECE